MPEEWEVLAAVSAGGVIGALGRYGLSEAVTHRANDFPWATLIINVTGCLLIGVLMVVLVEVGGRHRLARPFLGVGVLGGYTTFSTFSVDVVRLVREHETGLAVTYLVATVIGCALAVRWATEITRWILGAGPLDPGPLE
ncbi:MAG: camphor resistance protein CrcB [Pseudonocardiales bacterium]|nr:camphor resistance protein CrcB [Pseudonocardiales bacterium]